MTDHPLRFELGDVFSMVGGYHSPSSCCLGFWRRFLCAIQLLFWIQLDWLIVLVTISMAKPSHAMIVLSQLDKRYFEDISGRSNWSLDFVIYKQGETEALAESLHARYFSRSVNLEIPLEAGEYVVHVSIVVRGY
jgi:hypothetical protein